MALKWPAKDPEEVLDFPVEFTDWVVSPDVLDSAVCVIESKVGDDSGNPMVVDATQFATNIVAVWLSGGVAGVKYVFKVTVTDDHVSPSDRTGIRRISLTCKEK